MNLGAWGRNEWWCSLNSKITLFIPAYHFHRLACFTSSPTEWDLVWDICSYQLQPPPFPLSKQFISKSVKLRACYQRQLSHASSFLPHWSWHHVCCRRNGILKERFLYQNVKFTALSAVCDNFKWNYLSIVMKQRGMRLLNLEDFCTTK